MMAMAKHRTQTLTLLTSLARTLSTGTEGGGDSKRLYQRLSILGGDCKDSVEDTINSYAKEGRLVTEKELTKIIRELRKYQNYKTALEITDWMEKKGLEITASSHAVRIDLISKIKGINTAELYFSSLPGQLKDKKTYGALLNCYCQEKMEGKAIALFEKLKQLNLASNTLAYANIMSLYMKLHDYGKVLMIFEEMKAANIDPDAITCGLLITCYHFLNDIVSAEKVVEEMNARRIPIDWSVYCKLACAYNSCGLYDKAELALKKAAQVMNSGNRAAYHELITLYAGAGNSEETIRVWELLKLKFPRVNNMSYHIFLSALNLLGEMDGMKQCFQEWESICVNYDVRLLNLMIDSYLRRGMVKEAEALREKGIKKGFGSDSRTLKLFIDYYMERGEMCVALKCLEAINFSDKPSEWKPKKEQVTAFLKHFEDAKDVDGAERFYQTLKKLCCLDVEVCESLIRTYVAAKRTDPNIHQRIREEGFNIGSETENLLATAGSHYL